MACFKPLSAYQQVDGSVVFVECGDVLRALTLPCGQCVGCRLERSRQWAVRCMHEAQMHERNSFVTLTYSDEYRPVGDSLVYRDFQLFMKRLRKEKKSVRFYMCGEYGEEFGRPHFHACLFGCHFEDRAYWSKSPAGEKLYRSAQLERLWPFGFASVGEVTFESAAYVARYVMKKITGQRAEEAYRVVDSETGEVVERVPEFNRMSLRPGIGARWLEKFQSDVYPGGRVVVNGRECRAPRYYDKKFESFDAVAFEDVAYGRFLEGVARAADNTAERLAVREKVARARVGFLKRSIS